MTVKDLIERCIRFDMRDAVRVKVDNNKGMWWCLSDDDEVPIDRGYSLSFVFRISEVVK